MTRKIGLLGIHGGGKTTTLYGLGYKLKSDGKVTNLVPEAAREARARGFPINRGSSLDSQLWMEARQMQKELEASLDKPDFVLTDRTVLDQIIYYRTIAGEEAVGPIWQLAKAYVGLKPYDLIFVFDSLRSGPQNDGIRDMSNDFSEAILKNMKIIVDDWEEHYGVMFYRLTSKTKPERFEEVYSVVKQRFY